MPDTRRGACASHRSAVAAAFLLSLTMARCGTGSTNPDNPHGPPDRRPALPSAATPSAPRGGAGTATPSPYDGGAPITGEIGANGGELSRIFFAVVGDTRPPAIDDTNGYPTGVINAIYAGIRDLTPRPPMVVSTGDYMYASASSARPESSQAAPQLDLYMRARELFPGVLFPAMGNHECAGATSSNCGPGAKNGEPPTYRTFVDRMLRPIGKSSPYYAIDIAALDGRWTAKFVFVAANAWSAEQEAWLETSLARATTYTFVVRHEPASAHEAPGVRPSERVMARHPYTLSLVGHSHTYRHDGGTPCEVLIGNGGAPLASASKDYGFGAFSQRGDGAIEVDMIDWRTGRPDPSFHFAVNADGSAAP